MRQPILIFLQARHTGIKICQQIAILMGCAVLPHLKSMVDIIRHGLTDENQKVCESRPNDDYINRRYLSAFARQASLFV